MDYEEIHEWEVEGHQAVFYNLYGDEIGRVNLDLIIDSWIEDRIIYKRER